MCLVDGFDEEPDQFERRLLAHAVGDEVGIAVAEDAGAEAFLPVVVVHHAPQTCLYAAEHDGDVGEELPKYVRIDDGRVLGTQVVSSVGAVGVFASESACSRVLVDHRVHAAWRDAEEETRTAQLAEVAQVAMPVGLRHNAHPQALRLQQAAYDGDAE